MSIAVLFLVVALILFFFGGFSRWWAAANPYHPTLISAGLFFATLSFLWPMINK